MATTTPPRPRRNLALTDDQLRDMLALLEGSDSVELKLTIPLEQQRAALEALDLDPLDGQIRLVHFFDTPDLLLNKSGIVVRARRIQGRGEDSVVKLRPVVPELLSDELRDSPAFVVEVDAMPGKYVCSGTLKGVPRKASVREVQRGEQPLRKLFNKDQRAFYAEHAPDIPLDMLSLLGPIFVLKIKGTPAGFARKMVVELWLYPDGTRILELSTKCAPREAFDTAAHARAFLSERGIRRVGGQSTKTSRALAYFSQQLR